MIIYNLSNRVIPINGVNLKPAEYNILQKNLLSRDTIDRIYELQKLHFLDIEEAEIEDISYPQLEVESNNIEVNFEDNVNIIEQGIVRPIVEKSDEDIIQEIKNGIVRPIVENDQPIKTATKSTKKSTKGKTVNKKV